MRKKLFAAAAVASLAVTLAAAPASATPTGTTIYKTTGTNVSLNIKGGTTAYLTLRAPGSQIGGAFHKQQLVDALVAEGIIPKPIDPALLTVTPGYVETVLRECYLPDEYPYPLLPVTSNVAYTTEKAVGETGLFGDEVAVARALPPFTLSVTGTDWVPRADGTAAFAYDLGERRPCIN